MNQVIPPLRVNAIYSTFQGEQNPKGIGAPVIFLRLQGCHIRCYKTTKGVLCDTPEALDREHESMLGEMTIEEIISALNKERIKTGISLVCLSGGDPLWNHKDSLHKLFQELQKNQYYTCVETSGTIDPSPYLHYGAVAWILDWKTPSSGYEKLSKVHLVLDTLTEFDYIKFVIADPTDYTFFITKLFEIKKSKFRGKIAVGVYMETDSKSFSTFDLLELLKEDRLLGDVVINMQTHKMAYPNYWSSQPRKI